MTLPLLRRLHKWVALVVGLQIALWCISGATFAWLDHHRVSGDHFIRDVPEPSIPAGRTPVDPRQWRDIGAQGLYEVSLQPLDRRWVYRLVHRSGVDLFDAYTGEPVAVDEAAVRAIAGARYAGSGRLVEVVHHPTTTLETRDHGASWAAHFDDDASTTLWLSAEDARLLEVRSDSWRLFDFFWMLHTMDYEGRDDFNHPMLILIATSSLWVSLTGLLLVIRLFRPKRVNATIRP